MAGFRDLKVWQMAKSLSVAVYRETRKGQWSLDRGLQDQIRRAAVSVPSNIAEGDARKSQKDSIRFFYISLGSLAELSTQLEIASEIDCIDRDSHQILQDSIRQLESSLGALIKKRKESLD